MMSNAGGLVMKANDWFIAAMTAYLIAMAGFYWLK
jgi:hypothetical protein